MYEFARQVAGDRAEVVSLVPAGVEPHDWEPTPQDIVLAQGARVIVVNGSGLEPWAGRVVREAGTRAVIVTATEGLPLEPSDPHVWLDPVLAQSQAGAIRAGLARADPDNARVYAENARAYQAKLAALHEAFQAGLRDCATRDLVVSHAAFGYLARRYGLTMVPIMGTAPEAEPSPAQLAAIVRLARERKVRTVFFETLLSPRLAETLAREVGARTLVLNPVEGLTKEEAAAGRDYVALMEENLRNLRAGLDCR